MRVNNLQYLSHIRGSVPYLSSLRISAPQRNGNFNRVENLHQSTHNSQSLLELGLHQKQVQQRLIEDRIPDWQPKFDYQ